MTDTTTGAVDKVADLIERLEYGVCPSGIHEDNQTELFLVDDANDTMAEAAATIRALATQEKEIARLRADLAAEKALADRLYDDAQNMSWIETGGMTAYRKARGL